MVKRVIVPLDGSELAETALAPAAEVARASDAELVPLTVVPDEDDQDRVADLERAVAGLDVATRPPYVLVGDDAASCIADAGAAPDSLVVMTSHGSSGVRRAVLGSVAERVVRTLDEPVMLIGPGYRPGVTPTVGRMIVALDGSDTAEAILPAVRTWCGDFAVEPWIVTVVDDSERAAVEGVDQELAEVSYVRRVSGELRDDGLVGGWEVLHYRDAAGPLVTFAHGLPASVVAMTTHGRTGLARLTLGSVATRVLHDAPCPLLVRRPPGLAA